MSGFSDTGGYTGGAVKKRGDRFLNILTAGGLDGEIWVFCGLRTLQEIEYVEDETVIGKGEDILELAGESLQSPPG